MPTDVRGLRKAMLATLRAKLPKSDPVIEEGNKEGYGFIHLFGGIWGASEKPTAVRNWIYHVPGSRYDTPGTIKALAPAAEVGEGRLLQHRLQRGRVRRVGRALREGQGRDVDRRRLGLDDHQGGSRARTSA